MLEIKQELLLIIIITMFGIIWIILIWFSIGLTQFFFVCLFVLKQSYKCADLTGVVWMRKCPFKTEGWVLI